MLRTVANVLRTVAKSSSNKEDGVTCVSLVLACSGSEGSEYISVVMRHISEPNYLLVA